MSPQSPTSICVSRSFFRDYEYNTDLSMTGADPPALSGTPRHGPGMPLDWERRKCCPQRPVHVLFKRRGMCGLPGQSIFILSSGLPREYDIVEGVCIEIRQHPLQRSCKAKFVDADDHTHVFSLEKGTRVFVGCQYRFYLRRQDEAAKSASQLLPFSPPAELLGYEKIEDASLPDPGNTSPDP